jgi:hypothetical protein
MKTSLLITIVRLMKDYGWRRVSKGGNIDLPIIPVDIADTFT